MASDTMPSDPPTMPEPVRWADSTWWVCGYDDIDPQRPTVYLVRCQQHPGVDVLRCAAHGGTWVPLAEVTRG